MRLNGLIAGALVLGLIGGAGCGDKAADGGKSADGGKTDGGKTDGDPKPAPAKVEKGGASPQDAYDKAKAAADKGDLGTAISYCTPDDQTGFAVMMGIMPHVMRMMKPMFAMMAGMAGAMGDDDAKAEAEKQQKEMMASLDKLIVEMDGVCKKHKVELPSLEELGINIMGGEPSPADLAKKAGDKVKGVDVVAFVNDMGNTMQKLKDVMPGDEDGGGGKTPTDDITKNLGLGASLADVKVDGDSATGTAGDVELTFQKIDGRWYMQYPTKKDDGGMGGGDDGMGEDG